MKKFEWKPIETAPKYEGKVILGYDPRLKGKEMQVMIKSKGKWADPILWEWHAEPTHWMSLPKPPIS